MKDTKVYDADYYLKNKERIRARHKRYEGLYRIPYLYGITIEDFNSLLKKQSGVCAICGKGPKGKSRLCVDHDHETGKVRGLLCYRCNMAIGALSSIYLLEKAKEYLRTE